MVVYCYYFCWESYPNVCYELRIKAPWPHQPLHRESGNARTVTCPSCSDARATQWHCDVSQLFRCTCYPVALWCVPAVQMHVLPSGTVMCPSCSDTRATQWHCDVSHVFRCTCYPVALWRVLAVQMHVLPSGTVMCPSCSDACATQWHCDVSQLFRCMCYPVA